MYYCMEMLYRNLQWLHTYSKKHHYMFFTLLTLGVGFYLKERKPEVKIVLADPQVSLTLLSQGFCSIRCCCIFYLAIPYQTLQLLCHQTHPQIERFLL